MRVTSDESQIELGCEKCVSLTGGHFDALVYIPVLQRKYVILCNADTTHFYKFDTAVAEQNVLPMAAVIGAVES